MASRSGPPDRGGAALVVWTLFSAVVGAGFATGQELVPFLQECPAPTVAAAVACLVAGWLAWTRALQPGWPGGCCPSKRGSWDSRVVFGASQAAAVVVSWISLTAMEAALAHLLHPLLGPVLSLVAAATLVAMGATLPAARGLGRLSTLLGPFMAAALTTTGLWLALQPSGSGPPAPSEPPRLHPPDPAPRPGVGAGRCAMRVMLYASANGLFAERPLRAVAAGAAVGGSGMPPAAATSVPTKLLGLWGGALLGLTAGTGVWVMRRTSSSGEVMPLVVSAEALHPAARLVYTAAVGASAYTTAVAAAVGLGAGHGASAGLGLPGRSGWPRLAAGGRALVWVVLAAPVAAAGFAEAVQRLYPAAGWAALAAVTVQSLFAALRRRGLY